MKKIIIDFFKIKNMIIAFLIICSILIFRYLTKINGTNYRDEILNNKRIVNGEIIDYVDIGDAGSYIRYKFKYNNIIYEGTQNPQYSHIDYFINIEFPVIFNCRNPKSNSMLILPANFEFFDMNLPDSLAWVIEYDDSF